MTDNRKWFGRRFGKNAYNTLEMLIQHVLREFWMEYEGVEDKTAPEWGIYLSASNGDWHFAAGGIEFTTDREGRGDWRLSGSQYVSGSILWESSAEGVALELIEEMHNEFSDIEDWTEVDIPFVEGHLEGEPYVIYIRSGQNQPELSISTIEQWNRENNWYIDSEDEDPRIAPQFHIAEPRTPLEDALKAYRKYLEDERLSYLLED